MSTTLERGVRNCVLRNYRTHGKSLVTRGERPVGYDLWLCNLWFLSSTVTVIYGYRGFVGNCRLRRIARHLLTHYDCKNELFNFLWCVFSTKQIHVYYIHYVSTTSAYCKYVPSMLLCVVCSVVCDLSVVHLYLLSTCPLLVCILRVRSH